MQGTRLTPPRAKRVSGTQPERHVLSTGSVGAPSISEIGARGMVCPQVEDRSRIDGCRVRLSGENLRLPDAGNDFFGNHDGLDAV